MILHVNIQGLTSHISEIRQLVTDNKPLVVCIGETHVTSDIIECEIDIPGYNTVICHSNSRHTGGVIVYIQGCLNIQCWARILLTTIFGPFGSKFM